MTLKHILALLFAIVTFASVFAQEKDELSIPLENDNHFPPENNLESDIIEGSGAGVIEEPVHFATQIETTPPPIIEDINADVTDLNSPSDTETPTNSEKTPCPNPCNCHIEGESNDFVADCSGLHLTEFPTELDPRINVLNMQNNQLTEISKEVSVLKNLKKLNANNNSIMELASGSVSELPELVELKLANNRLIDYPQDLKNSLSLTKLEELDLGGNDMRTTLTPEIFSNFISLHKLTLATADSEFVENVCSSLKETLQTVCTESCTAQLYECQNTKPILDEDLMDAALPGTIALSNILEDNINDPPVQNSDSDKVENDLSLNGDKSVDAVTEPPLLNENPVPASDISLPSAISKNSENVVQLNSVVDIPKEENNKGETDSKIARTDVKIGATTSDNQREGVDKSVIGIIVAGMVLIVAGITIKKNWSSIRSRFSSTPRPANERTAGTANGTAPEEVPLQDKSPV